MHGHCYEGACTSSNLCQLVRVLADLKSVFSNGCMFAIVMKVCLESVC